MDKLEDIERLLSEKIARRILFLKRTTNIKKKIRLLIKYLNRI